MVKFGHMLQILDFETFLASVIEKFKLGNKLVRNIVIGVKRHKHE